MVLILITLFAPFLALVFLRPAKPASLEDLEDPPILRMVEVTVDRIQPLPWTYKDRNDQITARFALGWIGSRALVIRTDLEIPAGPTFVGILQGLARPEEQWVAQEPSIAAVAFPAELDVSEPFKRIALGVGGAIATLITLGIWIWRIRRWSAPERATPEHATAAVTPLSSRFDTPLPRSDELAAAVARKHAPLYGFLIYFVLYAIVVMAVPGLMVTAYLEPQFDTASTARQLIMFALGLMLSAPVTCLPFVWWMRRRRGRIARVARDGELHDGVILSAVVKNPDTVLPHTLLVVTTKIAGERQYFRSQIRGVPPWVQPEAAVRVVTSPTERCGIVIAPTGDEILARRT